METEATALRTGSSGTGISGATLDRSQNSSEIKPVIVEIGTATASAKTKKAKTAKPKEKADGEKKTRDMKKEARPGDEGKGEDFNNSFTVAGGGTGAPEWSKLGAHTFLRPLTFINCCRSYHSQSTALQS